MKKFFTTQKTKMPSAVAILFLLLSISNVSVAQEMRVSGRVLDASDGEPLPAVTILLKGTSQGTVSDVNGDYAINVPSGDATLIYSFIGFQTMEVPVNGRSTIDLQMELDVAALEEIVVVGYGTKKRGDLTGSVASVPSEDLTNLPARDLGTALQGRVPGVYVSPGDGNPNSGSSVVIRGPLSINGGKPLYVVDGVPFQGTGFNFNVQDIESIDVLKDASAAAIYGFQAAGGVILITTKKGKAGDLQVGLNTTYGVRDVINLPETLGRDRYIEAKEAFGFNVEELYGPRNQWSSLPDTDWMDYMFRSAAESNVTLSLSGGGEKSNFYMSGNYGQIEGTRIGNELERYTFRLNSEHQINDKITVGQTFYGNFTEEDPNRSTNQGNLSFRQTPIMNPTDPDNPIGGWGKLPVGFQGGNDAQAALGNTARNEDYEALLTLSLNYEIIENLNFKTVFGTSIYGSNDYFAEQEADLGASFIQSRFRQELTKGQNFISTNTLDYSKAVGDHSFSALIGYEARRANFSQLIGGNINALVEEPLNFDQFESVATAFVEGRNTDVDNRVLSQFARLDYSFADKYLVSFNVRRDGLGTKFGPNNRYGVFPGVSAGWRISEEAFMQDISFITQLKLRAGYGQLGNSVGTDFAFLPAYEAGYSADFGSGRQNSLNIADRLPNPDIQWETVATTNIGIDAVLLEGKLAVTLDYYDRQTQDMIFDLAIPTSAGLGTLVEANVGQMSNTGFEFNIQYNNKIGDFTYSVGFNGARNRNELEALNDQVEGQFLTHGRLTEAHSAAGAVSRSEPGRELANFYGFEVLGIYQDDAGAGEDRATINGGYVPVAGDLIYNDLDGNGVINDDDRTYIGSPWPDFNYGINIQLGWKGFDVVAFFNGVAGADIYNGFQTYESTLFSDYTTTERIFNTSGFNGNGVTDLPRVGTIDDNDRNLNWTSVNSFHVQNGSYLRLRNLQIGYTLPPTVLDKLGIRSLRIFAMADNLLTITGYDGMNPDIAPIAAAGGTDDPLDNSNFLNRGIDNANTRYPISRLMSLGLNVNF